MDNFKSAMRKVITWCIIITALLPVGLFMTICQTEIKRTRLKTIYFCLYIVKILVIGYY